MRKPIYSLADSDKKGFAGIFLLDHIAASVGLKKKAPILFLERDQEMLEPILEWLMVRGWVDIKRQNHYAPTEKGGEALKRFVRRYMDFLRHFDVFAAVDLKEGSFAFEQYFVVEDEAEWQQLIDEERWEDLRVSVAALKAINPIEIVFMHFVQERRFGFTENSGWEFDLLLGSVWGEILNICNSAVREEELTYTDEKTGEQILGREVLEDIVRRGAILNERLFFDEGDWLQQQHQGNGFARLGMDLGTDVLKDYELFKNPYYSPIHWQKPLWKEGEKEDH